jgi:hypothetical protein
VIITRGARPWFLQQLAQQALGRLPVTPALDQDIEHDPFLEGITKRGLSANT